jgi:hypothetical protein
VDRERRALPTLAMVTGLAWMVAVLLVAAHPKSISLAGDLAYDWANRAHTVALVFLLATSIVVYRTVRARGLPGARAATVLVIGAVLMLVGNAVSFWGALVVGQQSERFWGGWVGWLIYLPGQSLLLSAAISLGRAARFWPNVSLLQRWAIGLVGLFLSITTATWAASPAVTLVPAVLAAFALLAMGMAVAQVDGTDLPEPAMTGGRKA